MAVEADRRIGTSNALLFCHSNDVDDDDDDDNKVNKSGSCCVLGIDEQISEFGMRRNAKFIM